MMFKKKVQLLKVIAFKTIKWCKIGSLINFRGVEKFKYLLANAIISSVHHTLRIMRSCKYRLARVGTFFILDRLEVFFLAGLRSRGEILVGSCRLLLVSKLASYSYICFLFNDGVIYLDKMLAQISGFVGALLTDTIRQSRRFF